MFPVISITNGIESWMNTHYDVCTVSRRLRPPSSQLNGKQRFFKLFSFTMASAATSAPVSARDRQAFVPAGMAAILALALAKLLFHIYFNNRYGYFRDE